ncbi:AlkA N-terminal domain-containing protein [Rhodococcus kroppenstedtii]|uniref:DNA-3-methyladenine glycosylase family protein n=1 Tax=Rhodococcoides kroppenstedtii TaxID=293050 RepID=UPI0029553202|nr:AlkA N-terminal domain-containing protein [Rhodococcus kroppenstedtii]MDV7196621.1 AlkA N-terminal domain-containing protein [Rhodococcus kroppenstedtii]
MTAPRWTTTEADLDVTEPYDVRWMTWFLAGHAVPGMETVVDGTYRRSLRLAHGPAVVSCRLDRRRGGTVLHVAVRTADERNVPDALDRVRLLYGTDVDSADADAVLAADPALAPSVAEAPGIRVPGSVDPSETLLRTMIGQQISLGAAATHTARLVAALGDPVGDDAGAPEHGIVRLFPTPAAVADKGATVLTGPARRVTAIAETARRLADGAVELHRGRPATEQEADLLALRGVGPWTARYVSMRVQGDPDVLLDTDLVVRQGAALLGVDLRESGRWSPWRSSASMHLWRVALLDRGAYPAATGEG